MISSQYGAGNSPVSDLMREWGKCRSEIFQIRFYNYCCGLNYFDLGSISVHFFIFFMFIFIVLIFPFSLVL